MEKSGLLLMMHSEEKQFYLIIQLYCTLQYFPIFNALCPPQSPPPPLYPAPLFLNMGSHEKKSSIR